MSHDRQKKLVTRRRVLRGIGGITLALPFLELFAAKPAEAAPAPKRYVFMFGGMSIGSDGTDYMAPMVEGPLASNITRGLKPLQDANVTDVVSLVSGLKIPVDFTPPAAGRPASFHSTSHQVLSTGQRYDTNTPGKLGAPSSDWIAAKHLAGNTVQPVLVYRSQPSFYRVGNPDGGTDGVISARMNASNVLEQVPPITSPRLAYEALFQGFIPPDPTAAAQAKNQLAMRKSVVDLVANDAGALLPKLGKADQTRMQRHFDELRALETRLAATTLPTGGSCVEPAAYGDDPPIGDAIDPAQNPVYADNYKNANGYSNEEVRANLMEDLIVMAFACDISRVSSMMLTHAQCFMNMYSLFNYASDLHGISHGSISDGTWDSVQKQLADCAAWHVKHFARLVGKLRDTEDLDGSKILDNTALALAFEGGWGFDLEDPNGAHSPHSTENMVMLVGGKAGGLHQTPGRHIRPVGKHPAAVLNTLLSAVGVTETLGEVTDTVPSIIG